MDCLKKYMEKKFSQGRHKRDSQACQKVSRGSQESQGVPQPFFELWILDSAWEFVWTVPTNFMEKNIF